MGTPCHGRLVRTQSSSSDFSRQSIRMVLDSYPYHLLLYIAIVFQTVALMLEGYAMHDSRKFLRNLFSSPNTLVYMQLACNIFFTLDLALLFAESKFSWHRFVRTSSNVFWLIIHILSTSGFIITYPNLVPAHIEREYPIAEIGRAFKALLSVRLARLMVFLPTLNHILLETINTMSSIANIFVFLFLCNLCSAVVGLYLLGDAMTGRSSYANLPRAMLTSFQIFSADSYTAVLYDAMAAGENQIWSFVNAVFVFIWLGFSNFVIGNLFIATIVTHIQVKETMMDIAGEGMKDRMMKRARKSYKKLIAWKNGKVKGNWVHQTSQRLISVIRGGSGILSPSGRRSELSSPDSPTGDEDQKERLFPELRRIPFERMSSRLKTTIQIVQDTYRDTRSPDKQGRALSSSELQQHTQIDFEEPVLCGFTKDFGPRQLCIYLDHHPVFDAFIFVVIASSCFALILTPQYKDVPGSSNILSFELGNMLNVAFTCAFLFEFSVRSMSRGFSNTRHAYLSSGWNRLDFGILVFAVIDLLDIMPAAGAGKIFRSARILSPLRAIKRNEGMKILIDAFIGTLQPIGYVLTYTVFAYTVRTFFFSVSDFRII